MSSATKSSTVNGFADWTDFYWGNSKEICSGFFKTNELRSEEKIWLGIEKLANSEPAVFWAVALHHPNLCKVMQKCIDDADRSHASTRDRVSSGHQSCLVRVVTRIILGFDPSFSKEASGRMPTPGSVCKRLLDLFPGHVLMPLGLMLLRHSPTHASSVMCGLFISCPLLLSNFHATSSRFSDTLEDISSACQLDAKGGRFQRKGAEILAHIERLYRALKQLWGLLHCVPFIAEYCTIDRMMSSLRSAVDSACPMLQHFIMTCELLAPRRPQLTKAVASIVNAAVDCASILTIFSRFISGSGGGNIDKAARHWEGRLSIAPTIVDAVNDSIHDHMLQHTTGMVKLLLGKVDSVEALFAQLSNPSDTGHSRKLGPLLIGSVTNPKSTQGGKVFSAGSFGIEYMSNLVRHGVTLEGLKKSKFILTDEARLLGATEDRSATHIALQDSETPSEQTVPRITSTSTSGGGGETKQQHKSDENAAEEDPLIAMVQEVLPDAPIGAIREALQVYNGNVETLLNEAMMMNLPPHLQAQFDGGPIPEGSSMEASASPVREEQKRGIAEEEECDARESATLLPPGLDFGTDMHAFLTSDFNDDILSGGGAVKQEGGSGGEALDMPSTPGTGNEGGMFANHTFSTDGGMSSTTDELFGLDDDMKQQIRQLSEMMYEDELDDAQEDPSSNYQRLVASTLSESDNDEDGPEEGGGGGYRRGGANRHGGGVTPPPGEQVTPGFMVNRNQGAGPASGIQGFNKKKTGGGGGGTGGGGGDGEKKYTSKPKSADQKQKLRQQRRQKDKC